jgi:hypothetical protein
MATHTTSLDYTALHEKMQEWRKLWSDAVVAIEALGATWHPASDADAERVLRQVACARDRLRNDKIVEASRRRKRPRSFPETDAERHRRLAAASKKPWGPEPDLYTGLLPKLVRQAALRHGISQPETSEEAATAAAGNVTPADLNPTEQRANQLLLGARRRAGGGEIELDAQQIADIVTQEWPRAVERPAGRPHGAASVAEWVDHPKRPRWNVPPISVSEFVGIALPILAAFAGVDRLPVSDVLLVTLSAIARVFDLHIPDEKFDSLKQLVYRQYHK